MQTNYASLRPLLLALVIGHQPSAALLAQGPLTPPGAPAPTMKTLDQIDAKLEKRTPISSLPFTINLSGSYYLTANLVGAAGTDGITVSAGSVTIDLAGFQLIGSGGAAAHAIRVQTGMSAVTIRNGIVRGWSGDGIRSDSSNCTEMRVEGVTVTSCARGIVVGDTGIVSDCMVRSNATEGILTGSGCLVTRCTAASHTAATNGAISVGVRSTVMDCTSTNNTGDGIRVGGNSIVSRCTAAQNSAVGINCTSAVSVSYCAVTLNTGTGINGGIGSSITDCSADANSGAAGISVQGSSSVVRCLVRANNSTFSTSQGILTGADSTVSECTVQGSTTTLTPTASTGMGIAVGGNSVIERCTINDSRGDGIRTGANCRVIGNYIGSTAITAGASGAAINVAGINCLIDGNMVAGALRGIEVPGFGCTIIRNRVQGATAGNYIIDASNNFGAIVVPAGSGVAISGSGAVAGTLSTTDPWANISQ